MFGYSILAVLCIIFIIMIVRTMAFKGSVEAKLKWQKLDIDVDRVAEKLSEAVKVPTISYMDRDKIDYSQFEVYHKVLREQFPLVHERMDVKCIGQHSLVYKWIGSGKEKQPILLLSHIDVVPIADGTLKDWQYPPFAGHIDEDYVWGRGTIDTKVTMIGALESAERLLEKGYVPSRDIYFSFGHDEEIQGRDGAQCVVEYFKEEGLEFEFVLDEGGIVSEDSVQGVQENVAIVGIAEKGYTDIEISVKGSGGHASMPPKSTALGQLAEAVRRLEKHQMPLKMTEPVQLFLSQVGPYMGFLNRLLLANLWLIKPLFLKVFAKGNVGNALLRTSTAVTMARASNASNVLPQDATATVNFRVAPGDSVSEVINHIKSVTVGIDIAINVLKANEPSRVSSATSRGYNYIQDVITHVFEEPIVAPYLVMAGTDSRYYEEVAKDVYRFAPILLNKQELKGIHGTNERITLDNLEKCVSFYMHLMMEV